MLFCVSISLCLYDIQEGAQFLIFSPVVAPHQACINMAAGSNIVQAAARALASVVAPIVDLDPANTAIYKTLSDKGLRLAGHQPYVFLNKPWNDAATYLCHRLTSAKVKLPLGAQWDMAFDDGEMGGLFDLNKQVNGGEPLLMENLFKQTVCNRKSDLREFVYDQSRGKALLWDTMVAKQRFQSLNVRFLCGAMRQQHSHPACLMALARGGCRVFWNCNELYEALNMKSFSNQGSKWVYTYMGKWQQYLESVGFRGNHCIRSKKLMPDQPVPNDGCGRDPACDVLPFSSMSTLSLLQSLVRWKAMSAQKGGLRHKPTQQAVVCYLAGLLASACGEDWTLDIALSHAWECHWPGKGPELQPHLRLRVHNGMINLEPWGVMAQLHGPSSLASRWLRVCEKASAGTPGHSSLIDVLLHTAGEPSCEGLYKQLLWTCSVKVELAIVQSLSSGVSHNDIDATQTDIMALMHHPKRLCHELWRYTEASRRVSAGNVTFSVSTDKAHVTALPLSNTLVTLVDETAFICVPQAMYLCMYLYVLVFVYPQGSVS